MKDIILPFSPFGVEVEKPWKKHTVSPKEPKMEHREKEARKQKHAVPKDELLSTSKKRDCGEKKKGKPAPLTPKNLQRKRGRKRLGSGKGKVQERLGA